MGKIVVVMAAMVVTVEEDFNWMMLFYSAQRNHIVDALEPLLTEHLPYHQVSFCNAMDALENRLRRPPRNLKIALLCISDAIEMVQLTSLRSILMDLRLLLILPRQNADTIGWAHLFGPSFIAYMDTDVDRISAVLKKMINTAIHSNGFKWEAMMMKG
jgi:hypothetical protein